jgi:hypothetical protein
MLSRRYFIGMILFGAGLPLLQDRWLRWCKSSEFQPIGDDLVVVEGWILRSDEAAAVIT